MRLKNFRVLIVPSYINENEKVSIFIKSILREYKLRLIRNTNKKP